MDTLLPDPKLPAHPPGWEFPTDPEKPKKDKYWLHALLFVVTLLTTTLSGAEWMVPGAYLLGENSRLTWSVFWQGLQFSLPFLGILTVHEFGHYGMARFYRIAVSLPFYIPLWLGFLPGAPSLGTLGAFIRIKEPVPTRRQLFDIGAAGPLAGYVAILIVLAYGYTHLPPPEYIFTLHPEYKPFGLGYASQVYEQFKGGGLLAVNSPLTSQWLSALAPAGYLPNPYELMHYPYLFAAHIGLFFTALNLLPIGQLDGGHILYGMVGPKWHRILSPTFFVGLVLYAGLDVPEPINLSHDSEMMAKLGNNLFYLGFLFLTFRRTAPGVLNTLSLALVVFAVQYGMSIFFPQVEGYGGWLVFSFVLGSFLGIYHPPVLIEEPIGTGRMVIGILSLLVFIISFSLAPLAVL